MSSLADVYAAELERIDAGEATRCGAQCECHEGIVCTRATHPHRPGESSPHLSATGAGLVQWQCHEDHAQ